MRIYLPFCYNFAYLYQKADIMNFLDVTTGYAFKNKAVFYKGYKNAIR